MKEKTEEKNAAACRKASLPTAIRFREGKSEEEEHRKSFFFIPLARSPPSRFRFRFPTFDLRPRASHGVASDSRRHLPRHQHCPLRLHLLSGTGTRHRSFLSARLAWLDGIRCLATSFRRAMALFRFFLFLLLYKLGSPVEVATWANRSGKDYLETLAPTDSSTSESSIGRCSRSPC